MLPEVIFGHIYRETPPYRLVTAQMRYNLFVISSTLFPTSLQCWANTIAYKRNKSIYSDIQFWLSVNKENLTQLRQYYADTFHTNFEDVLKVNNAIDLKKYDMARHEKKRIPDLLEFLIESSRTSCVNLWEGCMGLLIVLCEYEEYLHSDDHTSLAGELLERITTQITPTAEFSLFRPRPLRHRMGTYLHDAKRVCRYGFLGRTLRYRPKNNGERPKKNYRLFFPKRNRRHTLLRNEPLVSFTEK